MRTNRYGKYARTGWFGHTHEHALAARGIKIYAARKEQMMAPVFLAQRKEESLPSWKLREAIREGKTYPDVMRENALADKEDVRKRYMSVISDMTGNDVPVQIDRQGVDDTIRQAQHNSYFAEKVRDVLSDPLLASAYPAPKMAFLKQRMAQEVTV